MLIGQKNNRNKTMYAITRKVLTNIIKLMIKCSLLPLNVNNFFDFKLENCGSVILDAKTLIRT